MNNLVEKEQARALSKATRNVLAGFVNLRLAGLAAALVYFGLAWVTPLGAQEDQGALLGAYQKEFIFLDHEIRLLETRKKEVAEDGNDRVARARASLADLESRLLSLTSENARMAEKLRILEEAGQKAQDAVDLVQSIRTQGAARAVESGLAPFEQTPEAQAAGTDPQKKLFAEVDYSFRASLTLLERASDTLSGPGSFFLADGRQVNGQIMRLGRIAALGTSGAEGGTLAPAGGGQFKLARGETRDQVRQIIQAPEPASHLPLYIFQGFDKNVDTNLGKTLQDVLDAGGAVGYVIILVGILGMIFAGIRAWTLRSLRVRRPEMLEEVMGLVKKKKLEKAKIMSPEIGGALSRVIHATLYGLQVSEKTVEDAISAAVLKEQGKIDLFRSVITVFAAVAPLLGLLGTVTGMIATFDIITLYGTGDPKLLSGGISEALVTTEFGLVAAIPLLLIGNVLSSWADGINSSLEVTALRVLNTYEEAKAEED